MLPPSYSELELEGFVQTMPGKGVYVKKINDDFIREKYVKETEKGKADVIQQKILILFCKVGYFNHIVHSLSLSIVSSIL